MWRRFGDKVKNNARLSLRRSILLRIAPLFATLLIIGGLISVLPGIMRFTREADAAPPTISAVSPAKGSTLGGETVSITGNNFLNSGQFVQLSSGATGVGPSHACGVTATGAAYCWGSDSAGALGDGGSYTDQASPVAVSGGLVFS